MRSPVDQVAQRSLARARDRNCVNRRPAPRQPFRQDCDGGIASRHQNRRVDFIRQSKRADVDAMAPRGTLHQAGRRREHETGGRLRHGNDFSAHAREHDPRLRGCCTTRSVIEPARIDQRRGLVVDFAEQRFDAAAKLAREADRDCYTGVICARLDRAERLPRDSRAPRQLGLREIARHSRTRHSVAIGCHNTCQIALKMAYRSLT